MANQISFRHPSTVTIWCNVLILLCPIPKIDQFSKIQYVFNQFFELDAEKLRRYIVYWLQKDERKLIWFAIMRCIECDIFKSLTLIDEKLSAFFSLETFDDNSSSIDYRDTILPSFDASHFGDSNEPLIIFLWPLDGELSRFNIQKKVLSGYFWQVGVYVKIRISTLNVNISRSNDPIDKLYFRPYSPDQGLSKEPKFIKNGSVDPKIFAFKHVKKFVPQL